MNTNIVLLVLGLIVIFYMTSCKQAEGFDPKLPLKKQLPLKPKPKPKPQPKPQSKPQPKPQKPQLPKSPQQKPNKPGKPGPKGPPGPPGPPGPQGPWGDGDRDRDRDRRSVTEVHNYYNNDYYRGPDYYRGLDFYPVPVAVADPYPVYVTDPNVQTQNSSAQESSPTIQYVQIPESQTSDPITKNMPIILIVMFGLFGLYMYQHNNKQ